MTDSTFFGIDETLINNDDAIEARVAGIDETDRPSARHALVYLYRQDGPISISRDHKSQAERHLNPVELFVFQWLYKRTDGKLRRHYGQNALRAVREAKFRCVNCDFADVRALHIEPVENADDQAAKQFVCLCANCQTVNAKIKEMEIVETRREAAAEQAATAAAAAEVAAQVAAAQSAEATAADVVAPAAPETVVTDEDVLAAYMVQSIVVAAPSAEAHDVDTMELDATDQPITDADEANASELKSGQDDQTGV